MLEVRTKTQQADILAQYLRDDRLHHSKNKEDSVLRKILIGLATGWLDFRDKINEVSKEYNPNVTTALLEEWEEFVGIPDSCIAVAFTAEQRRLNILLKLAGINVTTAKQFKNIALILGSQIEVGSGVDFYPTIPIDEASAPFTIVITLPIVDQDFRFPLILPFKLSADEPSIINCLFNKLKPANTQVYFRYI